MRIAVIIPETTYASVDTDNLPAFKLLTIMLEAVITPELEIKLLTFNVPAMVETPVYTELNEFSNLTVAFVNVAAYPVTSRFWN